MSLDEIKCVCDIYEFCLGTKRELILKLQSDNLITNNYNYPITGVCTNAIEAFHSRFVKNVRYCGRDGNSKLVESHIDAFLWREAFTLRESLDYVWMLLKHNKINLLL